MPTLNFTNLIHRPAYRLDLSTERTPHGTVVRLITTLPADERREVQFILDDAALARLMIGLQDAALAPDPIVQPPAYMPGRVLMLPAVDENGCDRS